MSLFFKLETFLNKDAVPSSVQNATGFEAGSSKLVIYFITSNVENVVCPTMTSCHHGIRTVRTFLMKYKWRRVDNHSIFV